MMFLSCFSRFLREHFGSGLELSGVGNLRKCGMRKVICGMKSAEVGCGTLGNMRIDRLSDR